VSTLHWIVAAAVAVVVLGIQVGALWRSSYMRMHLGSYLGAMAAGAALVVPSTLLERVLQGWAEIDPTTGQGGTVTLLVYAVLIIAPLEMGLCTLAVWPFWRLRRLRMRAGLSRTLEIREGVGFATSAALGFGTARSAVYLLAATPGWLSLLRACLWPLVFATLCALWGYVLGRHAQRGMRGRRFSSTWLAAVVLSAVADQVTFRRGAAAMLALIPLMAFMLGFSLVIWRDLQGREGGSSGGKLSSIIASAPAPSLETIRDAFRRQDRPLTLRWIAFGALVTTGVITAGLVGSVWLGHELNLDFAAVDAVEVGAEAMAPVALLGTGILIAFPISGYLLARASGTQSVLEPAVASSLAMVLVMVLLGMMAPVSVVFAVAFAPIGFALTCVGAWVGMEN